MGWPALGAVIVGLGGWIEPRVLGAGYASIQDLLGHLLLAALILLLVVKTIVWLVALGSGTSGGILAPLLIIGGALGGIAGLWLPGGSGLWAMIGMAGVMSAAMRAPLTAAVFAVELTGQFPALPETVAASGAAFAVAVLVLKRSILTDKVSRRGRHITQEFSVDPLALGMAGMSPAMAAGVSDRLWEIDGLVKLVEAGDETPKKRGPYKRRVRFQTDPLPDPGTGPVARVICRRRPFGQRRLRTIFYLCGNGPVTAFSLHMNRRQLSGSRHD